MYKQSVQFYTAPACLIQSALVKNNYYIIFIYSSIHSFIHSFIHACMHAFIHLYTCHSDVHGILHRNVQNYTITNKIYIQEDIACRTGRLAGPALYSRAHKEKSSCSHIIIYAQQPLEMIDMDSMRRTSHKMIQSNDAKKS